MTSTPEWVRDLIDAGELPADWASVFEAACRWWTGEGHPGVDRFGLTASADGHQSLWCTTPDRVLRHAEHR